MHHKKPIEVATNPAAPPTPVSPADALSQNLHAACVAEFGSDPGRSVYPSKYFRQDIYTYKGDPDGPTRTQRAPRVLGATGTLSGNAMNFAGLGDGWKDTADVPYLTFNNAAGQLGNPINAAYLLDYFNHGYGWQYALASAQAEVEGSFNA